MTFDLIIKKDDASAIARSLYQLLDEVSEPEVLAIDLEFKKAADKHTFLAQFESLHEGQSPKYHPHLLERWTHYRWLRLELLYLANQRAILNQGLKESIDLAILESKETGVSLPQSLKILERIKLQIVSTEHPTDPLAQFARDTLGKIANVMESETNDPQTKIRELLHELQKSDAIPRSQRDVMDEVNRNIKTLERLYDNVPNFVTSIVSAYQTHYSDSFADYEDELWRILLKQPILDASWAGFDADGNDNVTPIAMKTTIRLHRIRAIEKHMSNLDSTLIHESKNIEHRLREEIFALGRKAFNLVLHQKDSNEEALAWCHDVGDMAGQFLTSRSYDQLIKHYTINNNPKLPPELSSIFTQQIEIARKLKEITAFSGSWRTDNDKKLKLGALQAYQQEFQIYLNRIHDIDDFEIQDGLDSLPPREYFVKLYNELLAKYAPLLQSYPELKASALIFAVQLRSFGMTYGTGHVRQDSSVFVKFWSAIFKDLSQDPSLQTLSLVTVFKNKNYEHLTPQERMQVHKLLLNGSDDSRKILKSIHDKYNNNTYLNNPVACAHRELERFKLASHHYDMIENVIISNCENEANIFEVKTLLQVFPNPNKNIRVVPLLEKRQDLERYDIILLEYLKFIIQEQLQIFNPEFEQLTTQDELAAFIKKNPQWHEVLSELEFEVMVGFSDTERVSGLAALLSIQQVKEDIIKLAKDLGLQVKFYYGPGGDANRGGLARRDEKGTLQGNARSNLLSTPQSTDSYRQAQFSRAYQEKANPQKRIELASKPLHIREGISACQQEGIAFYEFLHDPENGLGKLFGAFVGHGAQWLVSILNLSSRASQRGVTENQGDRTAAVQKGGVRPPQYSDLDKLRAITSTQTKEVLRDNTHLLIGSGRALRSINPSYMERVLDSSETMRDFFLKTVLGDVLSDYTVTAHAFFAEYPHLRPQSPQQRKEWAMECEQTYPARLKNMRVNELLNNRDELLTMLSRLFALLEEEAEQTKLILDKLMKALHFSKEPRKSKLSPYTEWQAYTDEAINEVEPLSLLLARQNHHVIQGRNLDEVYQGLNDHQLPGSRLSGVGRLLGNIGAGITAFRIMPPHFCEINYRENLRPGVDRAEEETLKLGRIPRCGSTKNLKLFDVKTTTLLEEMLKKPRNSTNPSITPSFK